MKIRMKSMEKTVLAVTALGLVFAVLTVVFLAGSIFYQTALILSLIVTGTPFIIMQYVTFKHAKEIEQNLPDFLRDVAEANRSGMPIAKAIDTATRGSYGALSKEMRMVSSQISWGVPMEETLRRFAERVKSKLVRQAILIIIESHKSGGEISDILETVSTDIKIIKRIEMERKSKLKVYLVSTYFIFFLFLGIIVTLTKTFVPATPQLNEAAGLLGGEPSGLSEEDFKQFFFHLCLIQAFFAGLIGGQMGEGSLFSGIKHSLILLFITLFVFQFFLPSPLLIDKLSDSIIRIPPTSINVESVRTPFTIFDSFTSADLVFSVQKLADDRVLTGFEDLKPGDIEFSASNCAPCSRGDVIVSSNAIVVNTPSKVTYSVIGVGKGSYKIIIGGVE